MPQDLADQRWAEFDRVLAQIEAEHEQLRRYVSLATERLTRLHREADDLRAKLGINEVEIDTAPVRHLRAVRDTA